MEGVFASACAALVLLFIFKEQCRQRAILELSYSEIAASGRHLIGKTPGIGIMRHGMPRYQNGNTMEALLPMVYRMN